LISAFQKLPFITVELEKTTKTTINLQAMAMQTKQN